jgi:hypothetical protein
VRPVAAAVESADLLAVSSTADSDLKQLPGRDHDRCPNLRAAASRRTTGARGAAAGSDIDLEHVDAERHEEPVSADAALDPRPPRPARRGPRSGAESQLDQAIARVDTPIKRRCDGWGCRLTLHDTRRRNRKNEYASRGHAIEGQVIEAAHGGILPRAAQRGSHPHGNRANEDAANVPPHLGPEGRGSNSFGRTAEASAAEASTAEASTAEANASGHAEASAARSVIH